MTHEWAYKTGYAIARTGEYYFSGDKASRLGGALASAPYLGFVAKSATTIFRRTHYAQRLTNEGVDVVQAEKAVSEIIDAMRSNMTIWGRCEGAILRGQCVG